MSSAGLLPRSVIRSRPPGALLMLSPRMIGSTLLAEGTRRDNRPFVDFTAPPSGCERRTSSPGSGVPHPGGGSPTTLKLEPSRSWSSKPLSLLTHRGRRGRACRIGGTGWGRDLVR